jgi:hypothetical protein
LIFEFRPNGSAAVDAENHYVFEMVALLVGVEPRKYQFRGFPTCEGQAGSDG